MKKITDISQINSAVSRHFVKNVSTNNFISDESYLDEIENRSLYTIEGESYLLVLRKRENFYILNFHIHGSFELPRELESEKLVVEIPYKSGRAKETFFETNGFSLFLERMRMTGKKTLNEGKADFVKEEDALKAYKLLKDNFNKYSGCIPSFENFIKDVRDKNVLGYPKEDIKAILHFSVKGKSSEIRHLAVDINERKKGMAEELIKTYHYKTDCVKYQVWLSKNNQPAENLYKKYGYEKDGFLSEVYTKGI